MGSEKEQAAQRMKDIAIIQMKVKDYEGAWNVLDLVKNLFPDCRNIDHMMFVCDILKRMDVMKPDYGVNWLQILCIPPCASTATIQSYFLYFVECLEAIKSEFPETDRVQGILKEAMQEFCKQQKHMRGEIQPVNCANNGSSKKRVHPEIDLDRKIPSSSSAQQMKFQPVVCGMENFHNRSSEKNLHPEIDLNRTICTSSYVQQPEYLGYVRPVAEISTNDRNLQVVDDHTKVGDGSIRCQQLMVPSGAIPQTPHYNSFNAFGEKFRKCMIMGLEQGFMAVTKQISGLTDAESVKCNVGSIKNELMYLETMGFDVQRLRTRLDNLSQLAEQEQASIDEFQRELNSWKSQREAFEAKSLALNHFVDGLREEIQRTEEKLAIYHTATDAQKAKEVEIELKIKKRKEAHLMDSEIERTAKLPW